MKKKSLQIWISETDYNFIMIKISELQTEKLKEGNNYTKGDAFVKIFKRGVDNGATQL